MASQGVDQIDLVNGDSISHPVVVTDAQAWWKIIANATGILGGDIINVSRPGKTLKNPNGNDATNSLLYELQLTGNIDAPTYAFYDYSTRIHRARIRIGANDAIQNSQTWEADVRALLTRYASYPTGKVTFVNIGIQNPAQYAPIARINQMNAISKALCQEFNVFYADLNAAQVAKGDYDTTCLFDGLHPNAAGHLFDGETILALENEIAPEPSETFTIFKQFKVV